MGGRNSSAHRAPDRPRTHHGRLDRHAHVSPCGRGIALTPSYAGARVSEVVRLDVDGVQMAARKGRLRQYGKGGKFREVDIHPKLRTELQLWLDERPNWPHTDDNRALFLNAKGGRLGARAAGGIIAEITQNAGLGDPTTAHTSCATRSPPRWSMARPTWFWSPRFVATPGWRPPAPVQPAVRRGQGGRPQN